MNLYDFFSNNKKINIKENIPTANEVEKQVVNENLHKWFKEKWVRFGPDGKIRGDCARGDDSEGKPKCLPRAKAHSLGKKGRASAAARKRREDPNPERSGSAINVATKSKRKIDEQTGKAASIKSESIKSLAEQIGPRGETVRLPPTPADANFERYLSTLPKASDPASAQSQPQRRGTMPRVGTDFYYVPGAAPNARSQAAAVASPVSSPQIVGSTGAGARAARAADSAAAARVTPPINQPPRRVLPPKVDTDSYSVQDGNIKPDARHQARIASQAIQRDTEAQKQAAREKEYAASVDSADAELGTAIKANAQAAREKEYATSSDQEDTDLATAMNKMAADLAKTASTDDQLAAAANVATGGYSGGKRTEPTDDQLAAAANVATGGYSGGRGQPTTVSTPTSYTLRRGDTLSQLASKFDTTTQELMRLNPDIKDPNKIYAGMTLNVSKPTDAATGQTIAPDQSSAETQRLDRQPVKIRTATGQTIAPDQSSAETQRLDRQPVKIMPGTVGTSSGQLTTLDGTPWFTGYPPEQEIPVSPPSIRPGEKRADRAGGSADLAGDIGRGEFSAAGKPSVRTDRVVPPSSAGSASSTQTGSGLRLPSQSGSGLRLPPAQTGAAKPPAAEPTPPAKPGATKPPAAEPTPPVKPGATKPPAAEPTPPTKPGAATDDQTKLRQNLTPGQLKYAGDADLSRPATGTNRVIEKMPLPDSDRIGKAFSTAEASKNPNLAYGDAIDKNGNIVSTVRANRGIKIGQRLLTAEQWSEKELGQAKKLSNMTISEVQQFQKYREANHKNANAVGAYQFVGDTLESLVKNLGLNPKTTIFNQKTQNLLLSELTKDNANTLKRNGILPDIVNIYMAHAVGGRGAVGIYDDLRKDSNKTVIDSIMDTWKQNNPRDAGNPRKVAMQRKILLAGNPHMTDMRIGEYYDYLKNATEGKTRNSAYTQRSNAAQQSLGLRDESGRPNEQGIRKYQKSNGLRQTGEINWQTIHHVNKNVARQPVRENFEFSPEQEKWLGNANRQDPYIIARMPGPKPPAEYFTNPEDQRVAQQIVRSQDLANKWQEFRQGGSLASKAISRIPGVSQAANVVDIGANLAKGDLPAAGRQALGMIPAARPINLALQAGDVASNLQQGNLAAGAKGALGIASGTGSETAGRALKGWNLFNRLQKTTQSLADKQNESTMENICPHCGGLSVDDEMLAEKKDACYHKVKSRYKVWPSAYASGALVKCRKKGAKNWGKSKANEDSNLYFNITGTDKKTLISEFKLNRNNKGWYLKEDSPSSVKLDAIRAFGMPLSEEELNPTAYSGTAATIGVDNPRSPVGSVPKSQRINSKQKGKK